jgi:type IV pilus assembly protein PilV
MPQPLKKGGNRLAMNITLKEESGFTLLEIIIAISILTIGMLAVASMQAAALRGDSFAYSRTEASTWAQDRMEQLMANPYATAGNGTEPHGPFDVNWNIIPHPTIANVSTITVTVEYYGDEIVRLTANRSQLFT